MIQVRKLNETTFAVTVEDHTTTTHTVTVDHDYSEKLTEGKVPVERLVSRSFDFLLERESNSSILRSFNLNVIRRYFPEYEREIREMI